jgi:hypothetical protein
MGFSQQVGNYSVQEKIEKGVLKDWPTIVNGKRNRVQAFPRSKDKGKLLLDVRPPERFLADPSHRQKVFGSAIYKLIPKKNTGITKVDAERLKRNSGYAQKIYHKEPFTSFCCRMNAVVMQHFHDHRFCGKWCKYANKKSGGSALHVTDENKVRSRSKSKNPKMLNALLEVVQRYMSIPMLRQFHHPFNSQKNEAFNKSATKYAPALPSRGRHEL